MTDITDFANFDLLPTAAPLLLMSMSGDTEWMAGLIGAFTAVNYKLIGDLLHSMTEPVFPK